MIKFAQLNMNGKRIVSEQLRDYCSIHDIDLILVQEPPLTEDQRSVFGFSHGTIRTVLKPRTSERWGSNYHPQSSVKCDVCCLTKHERGIHYS